MTRLRIVLFRLWALVRSRRRDRELDDEIASHLAEATDEYVQQGLPPEDALWAARRSFGGVSQTKEVHSRSGHSCGWRIWRVTCGMRFARSGALQHLRQ
jgi:hypothetical protein